MVPETKRAYAFTAPRGGVMIVAPMGEANEPVVEIGEIVEGRYKIISLIGDGGMGSVWLAEHWLIKRRVALKILHREYASDADMIRRFMNEATAAGTLGHPNIVESTDMGFTRTDVPYIVFEYIQGTLLSDEIYRLGSLPIKRAVRIAHQIASALEAAHAADIVHRDLKTDNIFLTEREHATDHVKVLDFGISRFLTAGADRTGAGGVVMGTPEFMAPEQITNPDGVDRRADIYALGTVLYEMLAGKLPFMLASGPAFRKSAKPDLDATHALLHRIINDPPPPLHRPDAPPGLSEMIVGKLLAKDPAKRYASMKDVKGALEAFASVMQRSGPVPVIPVDEPAAPPKRTESAEIDALTDQTVSRSTLDPAELAREVKMLGKRWALDGNNLALEVFSRSMTKLAAAIAHAATISDEMDIHPTIALAYPKLNMTIRPYDDKSITVLDLVYAARLEQWLRENGW